MPVIRMPTDRIVSVVLAIGIAAAVVAGGAARPGVLAPTAPMLRIPVVPLGAGTMFSSLDLVEVDGRGVPASAPVRVPPHTPVHVVGWAVDPATGAPPSGIEARADGGRPSIAPLGIERADVARALARPAAANAGFSVAVDSGDPGRHVVRFTLLAQNGRRVALPGTVVLETAP